MLKYLKYHEYARQSFYPQNAFFHELLIALSLACSIGTALQCSPGANTLCKVLQDHNSGRPINTRIGDGNTTLSLCNTTLGDFLVALEKVRLDHDSDDAVLAGAELIRYGFCNDGLVLVVLL
jgi:hypothetical protein